jgi:uncharacterized protein YqjF (DUF2071 family)
MYQKWRSLLFLHWAFPPEEVRGLLPRGVGLELDTFGGRAYVGLVPFTMRGVRPAYLPAVPWLSRFHETNVRTYVHRGGRDPGVWFFSLDAANPVAVALARGLFHLPYFHARMGLESRPDSDTQGSPRDRISYRSTRLTAPPATCAVDCRVTPGAPARAAVGTLDHFLIERYLLYAVHHGRLYFGQVHHIPYPLQAAEILACEETLLAAAGVARPDQAPLVHFSGGVDVEIFSLRSGTGS